MMPRARAALWRLAELFTSRRRERDLADELDAHLQHHIDDNIRAGMTGVEARRQALLALGGIEQAKDRYRDRRGFPWLDAALHDLRYAARMLRRNPGFTTVAVLTLALGIGANSAIFSVVNAVLLRPLPFPDSSRLVQIFSTDARRGRMTDVATYPNYEDWQAQNRTLERVTAFAARSLLVADAASAELIPGLRVAPNFFDTLGVQPALGRAFAPDENQDGHSRVVILSDGLWRRNFAADRGVLGTTLRVNDELCTIVGVMPQGFRVGAGSPEQLYVPQAPDPNRSHGFLSVIGRLRPGVTTAQAQGDLATIAQRLAREYPKNNAGTSVNLVPLVKAMAGGIRFGLLILLGVVGLVLLIACTNVANLLLSRAAARQRELAVRMALGAGRGRLVRQLLTESVLLSLVGGALGLAVAHWTGQLLVALLADHFPIPRLESTDIDGAVLAFTIVIALGTGVLFGVAPALAGSSPDLTGGLHESSRSATGSGRSRRLRSALVVAELAMALILLAGAGALLKTLLTMRSTQPGFKSDSLLVVDFWLPQPKYAGLPQRLEFFDVVLERVRSMPGVRSAALVANLPLGGGADDLSFHIVGKPDPGPDKPFEAGFNLASTDYFRTMGIPIRQGREFLKDDTGASQGVTVINETAARQFWPGEAALGRDILLPSGKNSSVTLTVVGITGDVRHDSLAVPPRPEFFLHTQQANLAWPWLVLVVKTAVADPLALTTSIKSAAHAADPNVPLRKAQTMDQVLSASMAEPRVYTLLIGIFALLAVTLAAIGLYGVISYSVSQRTHELGIRVALGAARGEIVGMVLRQGLLLAVIGAVIGLGVAFATLRALAGLIGGLEPTDPITFGLVTLALLVVALGASYLPARRASQVDPMTALRAD